MCLWGDRENAPLLEPRTRCLTLLPSIPHSQAWLLTSSLGITSMSTRCTQDECPEHPDDNRSTHHLSCRARAWGWARTSCCPLHCSPLGPGDMGCPSLCREGGACDAQRKQGGHPPCKHLSSHHGLDRFPCAFTRY